MYHTVNCINLKPKSHSGLEHSQLEQAWNKSPPWSSEHASEHQLTNSSQVKLLMSVSVNVLSFISLSNSGMFSYTTLICSPSLGIYEPPFQIKSIPLTFEYVLCLGSLR